MSDEEVTLVQGIRLVNEEGFHKSVLGQCAKDVATNFVHGFQVGRSLNTAGAGANVTATVMEFFLMYHEKPSSWVKGLKCGFSNPVGKLEVVQ